MQNKRVGTAATATGLGVDDRRSIALYHGKEKFSSKMSRTPLRPIQALLLGLRITVGFRYEGAGNLSSFREKRD